MKQLGIYIHIPFCKSKCAYCDFVSFPNIKDKENEYINCLIKEIESQNWEEINKKYQVTTIYIGGGTPSFIDAKNIQKVLDVLKRKIYNSCIYNESVISINEDENQNKNQDKNLRESNTIRNKDIEISIEVNPGTVTKEKLKVYKEAGINRLSIGLQSTNNELLKQIGRIHTYEQFIETYNLAKEVGFYNINVDLMLGLPNQTIEDLKQSLEEVIKLNPNHISVYSLILEEGTPLYNMVEKGQLSLPDEEQERQMYWYVKNKLELSEYKHYEISNFAKQGMESKHNLNCWNQEEYIGFGLSAHSYFENIRYSNTDNVEKYIDFYSNIKLQKNNKIQSEKILIKENNKYQNETQTEKKEKRGIKQIHETQNKEDKQKEYMLLGLRKIEGVSISKFKEKFIENPIYLFKNELAKLTEESLIEIDGDYIKLTSKGLDFANLVWEELLLFSLDN
ncbi:MAG: radical SAM family heme chaperone HemW [Clostridia bacterium]|nr:radical SAM family heme chaperone HemW [Clostridia bacterium]